MPQGPCHLEAVTKTSLLFKTLACGQETLSPSHYTEKLTPAPRRFEGGRSARFVRHEGGLFGETPLACECGLRNNLPLINPSARSVSLYVRKCCCARTMCSMRLRLSKNLNRAIHAAHSFIRQISCARDITRLLAVWERARKVFISIAID